LRSLPNPLYDSLKQTARYASIVPALYDRFIPLADVERIRAAFPSVPNYVYPAGHGFDGTGARRDEASARRAPRVPASPARR